MIHPAAASLLVLALVKGMTEQALHRAEQQRMLLFRELNHRVKNILATVQAMTLQTARRSEGDLARFTADYGARLQALARAHDLLTHTAWEPVPARDAVEVALKPWLPSGQIAIEGRPQARLEPAPGQILVLALHELATNAAKYGALSRPEGRVSIVLQRDEGEAGAALRLIWQEAHGPRILAPPKRRGFGQKLLEQGLVLQSGGKVELEFLPAGLRCGIRLPLGQRDQAAATAAATQAEVIQARPGPADSDSPGTGEPSASQHRPLERIAGGPGGPEA
jgi:two-component sensor histidine kinase